MTASYDGTVEGASVDITSDEAEKLWVDGFVIITPEEAVNEIGDPHTFVVTATAVGVVPESWELSYGWIGGAPESESLSGPTVDEEGMTASWELVINSSVAGTFVASATVSVDFGSLVLVRSTDGEGQNSEPASKEYVDALLLAEDAFYITCMNTPITFELVAFDPRIDLDDLDAHPLVFDIQGAPEHGIASGDLDAVAYSDPDRAAVTVTYTPDPNYLGSDTITFRVADRFGEFALGVVEIEVVDCGDEPVGGGGALTAPLVISEVAWLGTPANTEQQWIELANTVGEPVDLTGWILRWRRRHPATPEERRWKEVELEGYIEPYGFYVLERITDEVICDVDADLVYDTEPPYDLYFNPEGDVIELLDSLGNVADTANADNPERDGWIAGYGVDEGHPLGTMERIDLLAPDTDDNWKGNLNIITTGLDVEQNCLVATPWAVNEETLIRQSADRSPRIVRQGAVVTLAAVSREVCAQVPCLPRATLTAADAAVGGAGTVLEPERQLMVIQGERVPGTHNYRFRVNTGELEPGDYSVWISMGGISFHHERIRVVP